eukprot:gene15154-21220_t
MGQGNTAVAAPLANAANPGMQSAIVGAGPWVGLGWVRESWGGYVRRARKTVKAFEAMEALRAEGRAAMGQGNTAEAMLRKELAVLGDRLERVQDEAQQLRSERDEMLVQMREVDAVLRSGGGRGLAMGGGFFSSPGGAGGAVDAGTVKALQEQLARAHADSKLVRTEKQQLQEELQLSLNDKKGLQESKDQLLQELVTFPDKKGLQESNDQLLQKLVTKVRKGYGERWRGSCGAGVEEVQRALTASEAANRDLNQRMTMLEREVNASRAAHNADLRVLQDELEMTQAQAVEANRKLVELRQGSSTQQSPARVGVKPRAGLIPYDDEPSQIGAQSPERLQAQMADLEARNDSLAGQLQRISRDRDSLEAENQKLRQTMEAARAQVQEYERMAGRPPPPNLAQKMNEPVDNTGGSFKFHAPKPVQLLLETGNQGPPTPSASISGPLSQVAGQQQQAASPLRQGPLPVAFTAAEYNSGMPGVTPAPFKSTRPNIADAAKARSAVLSRVSDLTPGQLAQTVEDFRIITDNPFEYEEDDEEKFHREYPHVLPAPNAGVRSVEPHHTQELEYARARFGPKLLAQVQDKVASYGVDPEAQSLSDREYAGIMQSMDNERQAWLSSMPVEQQEAAIFLRDALLTHIELIKRGVQAQHLPTRGAGGGPGGPSGPGGGQPPQANTLQAPSSGGESAPAFLNGAPTLAHSTSIGSYSRTSSAGGPGQEGGGPSGSVPLSRPSNSSHNNSMHFDASLRPFTSQPSGNLESRNSLGSAHLPPPAFGYSPPRGGPESSAAQSSAASSAVHGHVGQTDSLISGRHNSSSLRKGLIVPADLNSSLQSRPPVVRDYGNDDDEDDSGGGLDEQDNVDDEYPTPEDDTYDEGIDDTDDVMERQQQQQMGQPVRVMQMQHSGGGGGADRAISGGGVGVSNLGQSLGKSINRTSRLSRASTDQNQHAADAALADASGWADSINAFTPASQQLQGAESSGMWEDPISSQLPNTGGGWTDNIQSAAPAQELKLLDRTESES